MFKVFLDGVYHSTHQTFTGACRYARIQASFNQQAYFTVFEAGDENEGLMLDTEKEIMKGVPAYIIAPHAVTNISERRTAGTARLAAAASRQSAGMSRGV